ncbi:uncharacterized protein MONOS_18112 [Monocercomonoides exilis]|uniref:uncharacterized protein n=1 Tax=Monocercomonoides exilis TaxID=2049356 RepID=UPI00355A384A|nr:hypothetical protein MONOS_18112 [Monocercomonoides exilis]
MEVLTDEMWFIDVPVTLEAFEEDVSENWAPRWTRAWGLQMKNAMEYLDLLQRVSDKAWEKFAKLHDWMVFKNRRRPRGLRKQGSKDRQLVAWRKLTTPQTRARIFHGAVGLGRTALGYVANAARTAYRNDRLNRSRIHRRGRRSRYRIRRIKARKYRIRKRKYLGWLYKNRPPIYQSYHGGEFKFSLYNMAVYVGDQSVEEYPSDSIYSFRVTGEVPPQLESPKVDYILYKQRWEFIINIQAGSLQPSAFTHAYVRVLVFRKWGSDITNSLQTSLWSMFKNPAIMTSGYVTGFRRRWCKEFGVQLYQDKLLRISDETNWTTEFKCNFYPNIHSRYNSTFDQDYWHYQIYLIGGYGPEDKFNNLWNGSGSSELNVSVKYIRLNQWKYVSGMPLTAGQLDVFKVSGIPDKIQSNQPRIGGVDVNVDSGGEGKDLASESGASSSAPVHNKSFNILHDD